MVRSLVFVAGAAGVLLAGSASAAGKPLFVSGNGQADARNDRVLERLLGNPSTRDVKIVNVDASASDGAQIELSVGGRRVTVDRSRSERTATGSDVWYGRVQHANNAGYAPRETSSDPLNDVVLVRRGNQITGTVRVDGTLYRIRPLPSGATAVVQVDENGMPADHPEDAYRAIFDAAARDKVDMTAKGKPCRTNCPPTGGTPVDPGPTQTIRVMVVATNDAIASYGGDMQGLVELAVAESNQGYVNSNIGINMVLANYSTTSYGTVGMSTDLSRFRGTNDGYMDTIHATRDANAADVGVLVDNDAAACGLASGIGSTAATAFAVAYWDCITGYYSFAHEIGHLQSARHNPETDSSTNPYPYGHGYRAPNSAWRTVMAYNCTGSGCPRINYWSNPSVTYGGVPMGTYDKSHNQRVLVETKATVAGFR